MGGPQFKRGPPTWTSLSVLGFVVAATAGSAGLLVFIPEHGFSRQLNLIALFADALDHNLLAFL